MSEQTWGEWLRTHRDEFLSLLKWVRSWFPSGTKDDPAGQTNAAQHGVLVLGPGGVGKSTLGRLLSGQVTPIFDEPTRYDESLNTESYPLEGATDIEMVVAPGQSRRRDATWGGLLNELASGAFRGLIFVVSHGYGNHGLGEHTGYQDHPLFKGRKDEFLQAFLEHNRSEEFQIIRELVPHIKPPAGGKFWMLTLVTKQDLWWDDRAEVEAAYSVGAYGAEIKKLQDAHGVRLFRHELALASLVISNFKTGRGEVLKENTAGYDQECHARSFRALVEKLAALRQWESGDGN